MTGVNSFPKLIGGFKAESKVGEGKGGGEGVKLNRHVSNLSKEAR